MRICRGEDLKSVQPISVGCGDDMMDLGYRRRWTSVDIVCWFGKFGDETECTEETVRLLGGSMGNYK
jgi:hypothetical protein